MAHNREQLALELRQIIQADRQAAEIIHKAMDTRKTIEADGENQKAAILAEADRLKAEMVEQVKAEQAEELKRRKREAEQALATQRDALDKRMAEGREGWIDAIVERITG